MGTLPRHARPLAAIPLMVVLALALSLGSGPARTGDGAPPPCPGAHATQYDLNACAGQERRDLEVQMEALYRRALANLANLADDPDAAARLRAAQAAWQIFRRAHLLAVFPRSDQPGRARAEYGSVFPMCAAHLDAFLVEARIIQLRGWAEGVMEGDVCSGSRPLKRD